MAPLARCVHRVRSARSSVILTTVTLLAACEHHVPTQARPAVPPAIAALDAAGLPEIVRGRVLLGELGCVACHDAGERAIEPAAGPDLRAVGARVTAEYLRRFLAAPHDCEPGTVMPDLLRPWQGAELRERADALAAYLRSFAGAGPTDRTPGVEVESDAEAAARGAARYERIGCRTCHEGDVPPPYLRDKYPPAALAAFLLAPAEARPSLRMPDFALSPNEANDLAQFLCGPRAAASDVAHDAPNDRDAIDPQQVARGRASFAALRCARCHELPDPARADASPAPAMAALDPARGCLSGRVGGWPHYGLSELQVGAIRLALASDAPLQGEPRVQQLLAQRRCFACHRRGDVDAITARLGDEPGRARFGTDDASLGDEGRLPPPLTGVGGKLQRDWLARAIAHGQRERPYLHVRMPGFGEPFARELADLLAARDALEPIAVAPLPADPDGDDRPANAVRELGRELVGDQGMNCIACHRFAGEQAGAMGAIDLVYTTGERLRPEWFAHYLRDPFRFKPNTLMPHFFPDGKSTRPQFAGGDAAQQIDAMWHYLAAGRNGRQPSGLQRPPIELVVGDEAVVLRRNVQGAGKRGIAVGCPGGVNVTFDAEHLGLNQLWWGRFVDARAVWTSQGSGQAQILSRDVIALPNGPAFATLAAADAPWPTTTRRERGDRWLGYELDAARRPTFRYTAEGVTIGDRLQQVATAGPRPRLRRTLTFADASGTLWFRAAVHQQLAAIDAHAVRVGAHLVLRCAEAPLAIVAVAGQSDREVRVPIAVEGDGVAITIDYAWQEDGK